MFFGIGYGLFHRFPIQREVLKHGFSVARRVHHDTFFCVEALVFHIGALDKWHDGQVEMLGKGMVATVMCGHSHHCSCAIACQNILRNPNGYLLTREGIDGIAACKHARHLAITHAIELGALLHIVQIGGHFGLFLGFGERANEFAFGCQYHEGDAKDGVDAGGEDGDFACLAGHFKCNLGAFRAANPVALRLFDGIGPVHFVQTLQQTLGVGRRAQTPLLHLFLNHGVASTLANAVNDLIVGKHCAQLGAPVDHRFAQIGDAIVHQRALLLRFIIGFPLGSRERKFLALCHM